MQQSQEIQALLEWQFVMGVDEIIGEEPVNRLAPPKPVIAAQTPPATASKKAAAPAPSASLAEAVASAQQAAQNARTLEELRHAVEAFDGCPLKKTARNTVFADGATGSDIMLLGEAPGADEDRQGIPFCGASGQLLDKMLASIGLNRAENCYITNMLFWRPPGNRTPTPEELDICRPLVERHIELFAPKLIILVGGTAAKALLKETRGVMKLRGQQLTYGDTPARVMFHPSYLLRQPLQKKLAWQDLLAIQALLNASA